MTGAKVAPTDDEMQPSLIGKAKALDVMSEVSLGAAEPLTLDDQFINAVLKWLRSWFDEADPAELKTMKPCVFVFAGGKEPSSVLMDLKPAPSFKTSTDASLSGQVHVGALEMRRIFRKQIGFSDVSAAVSWTRDNGLQVYTCMVVSLKAREALILRHGVDPDNCDKVAFTAKSTTAFDFSQVPALLDDFHNRWTKSHLGYCRIWSEATKRTLKPRPESQIQGSLMGFFEYTVRPKAVLVDEEFSTYNGRGDVRLVRWRRSKGDPDAGVIETCIMELKVLSPKKSDQKNEEWALAGIRQLLDYREAKPDPGPLFLCCYDGRRVDADMPAIAAQANKDGVVSKRFFLETPGCNCKSVS